MKLYAPLFLCCLLGLMAGVAVLVMRSPEPGGKSDDATPRYSGATKATRERFLVAAADTDRTRRSARFEVLFNQLTPESAAEMAAELWALEKGSPFQNDWYEFLRKWAILDPSAALAFTEANAGALQEDWLEAILPAWAAIDPIAAAQRWLTYNGTGRDKIGASLIGAWANIDWKAAVEWIGLYVPGRSENADLYLALAERAVAVAPAEVQAIVEARLHSGGLPTAVEKELFSRLATQRLSQEGANLIPWLANFRSTFPCPGSITGDVEQLLMANVGALLSTNEEQGLWLTWLTGFTSYDERQGYYDFDPGSGTRVFTNWLATDPESASQWLRGRYGQPGYDTLACALVQDIAAESADTAAAWTLTIQSPHIRQMVWQDWYRSGGTVTPTVVAAMKGDGVIGGDSAEAPPIDPLSIGDPGAKKPE